MDPSKYAAAAEAVKMVRKGRAIGLGTGSTAEIFIDLLAKREKAEKLGVACIATSLASENQAKRLGLKLAGFETLKTIDMAFDGADQIDPQLNLIKGLGGALVREKIVDYRAEKFVVMAGESKLVQKLSGIVPVEVIPLAEEAVRRDLLALGAKKVETRKEGAKKFITDNSNFMLHAEFGAIERPVHLEDEINSIAGVVDNGIFSQKKPLVIAGREDGEIKILR